MNATSSMTVSSWLEAAQKQLEAAGIDTARLDALVILCDELGKDKSWIFAYPEHILQGSEIEVLNKKIAQRARHTPLAYIRGHAEFYGRDFLVDQRVLVPRPESEAMIDLLLQSSSLDSHLSIIDVGTGSGCLAITAKLQLPNTHIIAIDIDTACLNIAQKNATNLHAGIEFLQGDLLSTLPATHEVQTILANLPYVPAAYPVNQAASHEPALALFSGADGLDHYRTLFAQIEQLEHKPTHIITESLLDQHDKLAQIAKDAGYTQVAEQNLAQHFAFV